MCITNARIASFWVLMPASLFLLRIVRRQIGDVLVAQASGDPAHRRMPPVSLLVTVEGAFDVLGALTAEHRYSVDLRIRSLIARNRVTADTHRDFDSAGVRVAGHVLPEARSRDCEGSA